MSEVAEFMIAEHQELCDNVMHLEKELFDHMSFYTGLFTASLAAAAAVLGLSDKLSDPRGLPTLFALLAPLFALLFFVGRLELRMTMELRVRKMKFVEGITQTRLYFAEQDPSILKYLSLPVGVQKAPPCLRRQSKDWYQVIFLSALNAFCVLLIFGCFLPLLVALIQGGSVPVLVAGLVYSVYAAVAFAAVMLVFWQLSYRTVTRDCDEYDAKRERSCGESKYDLLVREPPKGARHRTFGDWIVYFEEKARRKQ